jgi:hypothetical protein
MPPEAPTRASEGSRPQGHSHRRGHPLKKLLATTALALGLASRAHAGNLTYDNETFAGVNIQIDTPNYVYGGAGPITLSDHGVVVVKDAWCVDVDNFLTNSGFDGIVPFTLANADSGLPGLPKAPNLLTQTQLNVIGWLVDRGDKATDATLQGAFQVAIWSEEYGSAFTYDAISPTFTADVSSDIATAISDAAWLGKAPVTLNFLVPLDPSVSQTLVFATGVPELPTWVMGLVGFGLFGFAGLYRSRKTPIAIEV